MFKVIGFILIAFINGSNIRLEGFKTAYDRHDKIEYSIINKTDKSQLVQIAIETKIEGEWEEAISDATNVYNLKEAVVYPIEKDEKKSFSHTIGFGNGYFAEHDKLTIRFKVTYKDKPGSDKKIVYSNPILINK